MRRHQHYTPTVEPPGLFDAQQPEELERVTSAISRAILAFCRVRLATDPLFHADDLRAFVLRAHPTAPASADRILRALRRAGLVSYHVVNRRQSLYRVVLVH